MVSDNSGLLRYAVGDGSILKQPSVQGMSENPPTLFQCIEQLRNHLIHQFFRSDFVTHAVSLGVDEEAAGTLFRRLVD